MPKTSDFFALSYTSNAGDEVPLEQYRGRPVLVVNTARHCGFAPQFSTLQQLHETYGPQGLVVLGFPCDQFAHQEPGDDATIAEECKVNFGVTFPLSTKIDVNGDEVHPVFAFLKDHSKGLLGSSAIKWNFTKFLVSPDGATVRRYAPASDPAQLGSVVEELLGEAPAPGA